MRRKGRQAGKTLVPLLGVLAVLAVVVAAAASVLLMQEREKRQAKERDLQLALSENEEIKGQLQEVKQAKSKLEGELTRVNKELTESEEKLAKSVEAQQVLSKSVEDRQREVDRLSKELEQAQNDSKQATAQLSEIQTERESLKAQLAELQKAKSQLETKLTETAEQQRPTVELDKVLVTSDQAQQSSANIATAVPVNATANQRLPEGQVVVINREYDFIVMNLGKKHGLSTGQEFQILRGNEVLGKVKVEKVYDELSAAAILPESKKENIREGDIVRAL